MRLFSLGSSAPDCAHCLEAFRRLHRWTAAHAGLLGLCLSRAQCPPQLSKHHSGRRDACCAAGRLRSRDPCTVAGTVSLAHNVKRVLCKHCGGGSGSCVDHCKPSLRKRLLWRLLAQCSLSAPNRFCAELSVRASALDLQKAVKWFRLAAAQGHTYRRSIQSG
jgi:hypothetical protein